jgi:protein SCO1/2
MTRRMLVISTIALLACAGAVGYAAAHLTGSRTTAGARRSALPPGLAGKPAARIRLADARGGTVDTASLRGRPYVVTFLYTRCPDVCPLIGEELRQALSQLGAAARRVAIVGVSVDPAHDTASAVRAWLRLHREPAEFHYAIGSRRQLQPVWKAYFAAPQIPGDPDSSHTATMWFVDARGRLRASYGAGAAVAPGTLAGAFRALLEDA